MEEGRTPTKGQLNRLARSVRRTLVLRHLLRWTAVVATVVGAVGLVATLIFPAIPRWPSFALLAFGPLIGLWVARRKRPSEADVVVYVDRRLGADEAILTAWEDEAAAERTKVAAAEHLGRARPKDVRPTLASGDLIGLPFAAGTLAAILIVPTPPPVPVTPGPRMVQVDDADPLTRLERLPEIARTEEERERLEAIAREAEELRHRLAEGMEEREALDALDRLQERIEEEARQPASPEERRARDAAVEALESEPEMARALAERDLESLDRAVAQAAARREEADRERARQALREAAEAAREEGDEGLAESLLRRESLLDRRSQEADLARQLAEAMPELAGEGLRRELERLDRGESDGSELSQEMVDAMREAWSRLTPEERQRLAEKMREAGIGENSQAGDPTEPGEGQPISADEYERMLREALEETRQMQRQMGGQQGGGGAMPIPGQGQGSGQGQGQGQGSGQGQGQGQGQGNGNGQGSGNGNGQGQGSGNGQGQGQGSGSSSGAGGTGGDDEGRGPGGGRTPDLNSGDSTLARVRPRVGTGAPSRTWVEWVDPSGQPTGGDAPAGGDTSGGAAPSGESGGIERAPIPEDYEEHVRTYFGGDR